jgi:hypothetical protein
MNDLTTQELPGECFSRPTKSAHPDLPNVQFTSDFRLAFTSQNSASGLDPQLITPVELTSKERQQLKDLRHEMVESWQSLQQAETNWRDYRHQLAVNRFPIKVDNRTLVASQWENGLAFTPDFRFAVARTH